MINKIMRYCNNYFAVAGAQKSGTYEIIKGAVTLPFVAEGQYFRVVGSLFNDGVYKYSEALELKDETFTGTIYPLAPPPEFLDLCKSIAEYQASDAAKVSPFTSESFGGYSYHKATGASGAGLAWSEAFRVQLRQWRRI